MRIGLDAMGGDRGSPEVIAGALAAAAHLNNGDRIVLVGDKSAIETELAKHNGCDQLPGSTSIRYFRTCYSLSDST